ncbi:hypothetical protein LB517_24555 [Mesorhizobium sp. BR1-1-12]|uniref:hypothetical protein n=1 Tax=unclassified Mesorhizobium TaxID=325217 RepID=UPI001CCF814F|nr:MULTISPECIES: hypothetical protein [unclassified Mesorhizobium]MBZ9920178.1 hypothetical protein [Mesorhizobium sp. BR1-1-7]MBZ9972808.1 hypothetical protein [Mesorhizobium sp. BR1-1-12]
MAEIPDVVILARFSKAVREMLADDALAKAAPEEFSITADLAIRMVPYFAEWKVSPEWTRREDEEKKLAWNDEAGKEKLKKIRPDIIVHKMLFQEENILMVEAKRAQNPDYTDDIRKLTLMTSEYTPNPDYHYGYRLGVHLIVDLPNRNIAGNNVYRDGEIDAKLTELLWRMLH